MNQKYKKFSPGRIVATKAVAAEVSQLRLLECLNLHVQGDWGTLPDGDWELNDAATYDGSRILSCYPIDPSKSATGSNRLWLITESEDDSGTRSHSTFLYPEEY